MTVAELLRRISAKELVDWQAYDQLTHGLTAAPAAITPRAAMSYERLTEKLDALWTPEP